MHMMQGNKAARFLLAWLALCVGTLVPAHAGTVRITSPSVAVNVTPDLEFLADPESRLTITDLQKPHVARLFRSFWDDSVNLGIVNTQYWFRTTLVNETDRPLTMFVELNNPRLNLVQFATVSPTGALDVQEVGTLLPYGRREVGFRNPTFQVSLAPGQAVPCLFGVRNQGSFRFRVYLRDMESFGQYRARSARHASLFFGALLVMALHSLVTYVLLRERSFLIELSLILTFLLFQMAMTGVAFQLLWPNATWWADRAIVCLVGLCHGWMFLYSRQFLRTREYVPGIDRWLLVCAVIGFMLCPANLVAGLPTNRVAHAFALMAPPIVVGAAAVCWLRGSRMALIFIAAWAFMLAGVLLVALLGLGVLPNSFWAESAVQWGVFAALALLSYTLAERIRASERGDREQLEQAVQQRTAELEEALASVRTLRGLIPICCVCKKVRDDRGYWNQIEAYILKHSEADLTHGICPDCLGELYGDRHRES